MSKSKQEENRWSDRRKNPHCMTVLADKQFRFLTTRNMYFCCKYCLCFKNAVFQENHCKVTCLWNLRKNSLISNIFRGKKREEKKTWGKPKSFTYFKIKCLKMCHKALLCFANFGNLIKINYKVLESQQNWDVGGDQINFLTLSYVSSTSFISEK